MIRCDSGLSSAETVNANEQYPPSKGLKKNMKITKENLQKEKKRLEIDLLPTNFVVNTQL